MTWLIVFLPAFYFVSMLALMFGVFYAFSMLVLRGENLSYLDQPPVRNERSAPGPELRKVLDRLRDAAATPFGSGRKRILAVRRLMDDWGSGDFESEFRSVDTGSLRGEWVLPPECDGKRRLLYIHGGAFFSGSPLSHRPITDRLAQLTGFAVFSLDYRLLPEHRRLDGIKDCRAAYRWILENGPHGPHEAEKLVVAGDSAGGNLTLSLIAWIRDQSLRQADAAIAFSPLTDAVLDTPSLRANVRTDPMLGPAFGYLAKVPVVVMLWFTWFASRIMPRDPRISPLRGSLSDLPPVLVQVSSSEMLFDDSRRYVAKAQAAQSPVVLQSWPNMIHVWQMFTELPEAEQAYDKVGEFLQDALA